jgi:hypothetical protein
VTAPPLEPHIPTRSSPRRPGEWQARWPCQDPPDVADADEESLDETPEEPELLEVFEEPVELDEPAPEELVDEVLPSTVDVEVDVEACAA